MLKYAGRTGMPELLKVFQKIMRRVPVLREWSDGLSILHFKKKGVILQRVEAIRTLYEDPAEGILWKTDAAHECR